MNNYILIDICGTLFYSNTTFDFLDYYVTNPNYKLLRKIMSIKIFRYINNIIYRINKIDLFRKYALKHLRGISKKNLNEMSQNFYNDFLLKRKNAQIWNYLKEIKGTNEIILISGTIDPIAEIVAKELNIPTYISSHLKYKNNICTGDMEIDALKKKYQLLIAKNIIPPYKCVITDNPGDISLIKQSKESFIIIYNNIYRWKILTKNLSNIHYINSNQKNGFKR